MSDAIEGRARSDSSDIAMRKIFIGGLSYSTDEEKLRKYFRTFGSVQDAVVMKDPLSKRSRGFGFITFYEVNAVDQVLANEPHTIDARKVEAKRAVPRGEMRDVVPPITNKATPTTPQSGIKPPSPQSSPQMTPLKSSTGSPGDGLGDQNRPLHEDYAYNKIFVGGLHYDTRDPDFRAYFEKYGKVISAEVMFNRETHKSRGFGFIVFEKEESAIKVCNEKEHTIDGKVVEVKRAIPRSKIANNQGSMNAMSPPSATTSNIHSTPTSNSRLLASHPTDSITYTTEIRSDVRSRTLSGSSLLSSPPPNSNNSPMVLTSPGILSLKPPQMNLSNSQLPPSGVKRIPTPSNSTISLNTLTNLSSSSTATTAAIANNNNSSYAAALKLGGSIEEQQQAQHQHRGSISSTNSASNADLFLNNSNLGSGIDSFQMSLNNNTSSSNLQSLLQSTSREYDVRQSRALSEPIKFDNSFAFSHDMFDLNAIKYGNHAHSNTNHTGGYTTSSISNTLSADNVSDGGALFSPGRVSSGGAGVGSISWLGSPPTNKFDAILDPSSSNPTTLGGTTTEFTRSRAHSIGPTTIASSSRSPGFLGYPNFGAFSHDGILLDSVPQSPAGDRQYSLGYGLNTSNPSLPSLENKSLMFSTPSRGLPPLGHHTPQSTASLKQRSPAPGNEWTELLHHKPQPTNDNSNLIAGSLLGLLGENHSSEQKGLLQEETVGVISTDTTGSRILSLSKSDSNDLYPQRRHSHPATFNQELYDASKVNELVGSTAINSSLWSTSNDQRVDR